MVTAGDARGRSAKVLKVMPKQGKVLVQGVNVVRRHVKPNPKYPQGGVVEKELPIAIANVQPVVDGKATRVRFATKPDGSKVRLAVKGGSELGQPLRKSK
ncbi:MAG: 50S ribosomal protein L24 [Phycisphaerales bacterium]|nr:50S ribosomal protein L24 [Phycisphaerales bacterium]